MAREERRRFCIDMDQYTVERRRILESVCRQLGRKMPTWAQLATLAINTLEEELILDCQAKGISYKELVAEANPATTQRDRIVTKKEKRGQFLDEGDI